MGTGCPLLGCYTDQGLAFGGNKPINSNIWLYLRLDMIAWVRDNLKEVELNCANKKCENNKKRFIIKYENNLIKKAVICPTCKSPTIISEIRFKRKNMK